MAPPHQPRDDSVGLAPRLAAVAVVTAVLAGAGMTLGGGASALAAPCPTAPGSRPGDTGRTPSGPASAEPSPSGSAPAGSPTASPTPTASSAGPSASPSAPATPPSGGPLPDATVPPGTLPGGTLPGGTLPGGALPPVALPAGARLTAAAGGVAAAAPALPGTARETAGGATAAGATGSSATGSSATGSSGTGAGGPVRHVAGKAAAAPEGPGASTPPAPATSTGPSAGNGTPGAEPTASAGPAPSTTPTPGTTSTPSTGPSPSASPTSSDIPCLGPRLDRVAPAGRGLPRVALGRGILTGKSLEMHKAVYRGVTKLDTIGGTVRALQFDMDRAVTTPFRLVTPAEKGRTVVTTSKELTIAGHVHFFATTFTGKLFGVIPVTFTPDLQPPLTPPEVWFTDVVIELALVQCDSLDADDLALSLGSA